MSDLYSQYAEAIANQGTPHTIQAAGSALQNVFGGYLKGRELAKDIHEQQLKKRLETIMFPPESVGFPSEVGNLSASDLINVAPIAPFLKITHQPSKSVTDVYRNSTTGEMTDNPSVATSTEWKKYTVPVTNALNSLSNKGNREDLGKIVWDSAKPQEKDLAMGLYNGEIRPYDLGYRERTRAVVLANEYAKNNNLPSYKSFAGDVAAGTAKAFATGKPGLNTLALNTALGHLDTAYNAYQNIGNADASLLNKPMNVVRRSGNDADVTNLMTALNAVRGEAANVFKSSGATDQEISAWKSTINENLTPMQAEGMIKTLDELLRSRLKALDYMRESGMTGRSEIPLLSPKGAEISTRLGNKKQSKPATSSGWGIQRVP